MKEKTMTEGIERARRQVAEELAGLKGPEGQSQHLSHDALSRTFPDYLFFSVLYRQYPVARLVPPPLKGANLFIVPSAEGKLRLVTEIKELECFFRDALKPVRGADRAMDVVKAWLQLSPVLLQDGYYIFSLMEDSARVTDENNGMKATGRSVVMMGGNGTVDVTAVFDEAGKLTGVDQAAKIRRGPRPICQALKLLDPDAIVRRMAEEDLLVIGSAAKSYLDEARGKASPELQEAIDRVWERIREEE
jgi:hypothetical protein